jgi:V/A-type H+-transporting ATPase subunit K
LKPKLKIALISGISFALAIVGLCMVAVGAVNAQQTSEIKTMDMGLIAIGASVAIAGPGLGAALGLGYATSSIAAAGAERPEIIGRFFIYIVFIEAVAIYGLLVAIFIILMLPTAYKA